MSRRPKPSDRRSPFVARRIGVRSPSHLTRVISGERSLTTAMTQRYSRALGLHGEEAEYFRALVDFNDAGSALEREEAYEALRSFRRYRTVHKLDDQRADFFAHWFMPAVLELATRSDFEARPAWVAKTVRPSISTKEAKLALDTLVGLGLLRKEHDRLLPADKTISTGAQTASVHVARYHRNMLRRAEAAMDLFDASERDVTAITLSVPRSAMSEIKSRLAEVRRELLTRYEDAESEQVVQVNFQLFPLSEVKP
ncbi:MAG: TIGR02147 family protein [Myxococcota bacterium]